MTLTLTLRLGREIGKSGTDHGFTIRNRGLSPITVYRALRFTLSDPDLDTTIVGTSRVEHLKANVAAASRGPLEAGVYEEAKRRLAAVT